MLYISTSEWVLLKPFDGWNDLFQYFQIFSWQNLGKCFLTPGENFMCFFFLFWTLYYVLFKKPKKKTFTFAVWNTQHLAKQKTQSHFVHVNWLSQLIHHDTRFCKYLMNILDLLSLVGQPNVSVYTFYKGLFLPGKIRETSHLVCTMF